MALSKSPWIQQKLKTLAPHFDVENRLKLVLIMTGLLALSITPWLAKGPEAAVEQESEGPLQMDTYIPAGHTMVPIRVADYEFLDQIFGQFGIVDLYTSPISPDEKSRLVARKVKLVRSGKNSSHFSALVPDSEVTNLTAHTGEFVVTVRNPNSFGTNFVKKQKKERRTIFFESEE